jgi:uncharacterized membrane protein
MKLTTPFLLVTLLLSGFYAGIGFFGIMGFNPAMAKLSNNSFVEYWQHIDSYMAARMKIFGPLLLLSVIISVLMHLRYWRSPAFWLLMTALLFLVADLFIGFTINHPLNRLIQSWNITHLPANVQEVKHRVVTAFYFRNCCMIGCFVSVLVSLFFPKRSTSSI